MGAALQAGQAVAWQPQPGPQSALISCPVPDVFFGGARGGGKTDSMLGDFAAHAMAYGRHASGVFFRRTAKQLEEVVHRAMAIYPQLGAVWRKADATWEWVSGPGTGARLKMRHLWDERDAANYQGHGYSFLVCEEIGNWPSPVPIDMVRATLRSAHGVPVRFRATGNPGGPGHSWVKARYIDPAPAGYVPIDDPETGLQRVFIPSRLEDNLALMQADPEYEIRLLSAGPPELVKAWRYGIWDIVAGGFFSDVWDPARHILPPFQVPKRWIKLRSFDWGSAKPASLGLWAESDGQPVPELDGRMFPRGSLVRFGEWYTVARDQRGTPKPNVGLRLDNTQLGHGIARASDGHNWPGWCVADPSIFTEAGGPSIYDQLRQGAAELGHDLYFTPADNSRLAGWQRLRQMLQAAGRERPEEPGLWVTETCREFIRTVPVLQMDSRRPDDIDTENEDHIADETRYAVMLQRQDLGMVKVTGIY